MSKYFSVKDAVCDDGSLFMLGWYLAWDPQDEEAKLDGCFTSAQLREIAAHMEKNKKP